MDVKKPIFIVGMGRSGTTYFTRLLALHSNIAFLSYMCERFPTRLWLNRMMMRTLDIPILQKILKKKITPHECWGFWRYHSIAGVCRTLEKDDVTLKMKSNLKKVMGQMLTKKRNRLLIHLTGWPRAGFLKEIFPDAKFITMIRDPRATINSVIHTNWWEGWLGPNAWGWGQLSHKYIEDWEKYNKSFVILAAIQYKRISDSVEAAKKIVPLSDFFELKYEDLCTDTINTLHQVTDFCELDWSLKFKNDINMFPSKIMNYKWKDYLTEYQKKILNEYLSNYIKKYKYDI